MEQELISKVWQLHGALAFGGVTPGLLLFKEEKISFKTDEAEEFNVPLAEMKEIKWPFYEFGLCFTTMVNGKKYRFIFSDPSGANTADTPAEKVHALTEGLDLISTGREAAKKWKAIFGKQ
jgi:hypothetical protein